VHSMQTSLDLTYSPAVLIVDDDASARKYYRERFHEETSLGVITAANLAQAKVFIDSPSLKIDAVVADLFFDIGTDAPDQNLFDGLDILSVNQRLRPSASQYVLSYWSGRGERHQKADELGLKISSWFEKAFLPPGETVSTPWAQVERDIIRHQLEKDRLFAERLRSLGVELAEPLNVEAVAETVRQSFHPPKRTYLQECDDPRYLLLDPIEVICFTEETRTVRANAWRLGVFTEGLGESTEEALLDLGIKLVEQYELFEEEPDEHVEGYARLVRDRLRGCLRKRAGNA